MPMLDMKSTISVINRILLLILYLLFKFISPSLQYSTIYPARIKLNHNKETGPASPNETLDLSFYYSPITYLLASWPDILPNTMAALYPPVTSVTSPAAYNPSTGSSELVSICAFSLATTPPIVICMADSTSTP